MAKGSRPKKSSQPKTSSRGLSPRKARGTVPVSTQTASPAIQKSFKPKVDPLELFVTLVAGAEDLGVNAARALLRLRRAQLAARDGARGAIIKIQVRDGTPDLLASAAATPLLGDFFSLVALDLVDCFPGRVGDLRRLMVARRKGLDLSKVFTALWTEGGTSEMNNLARRFGLDSDLLAACTWVAAKPLLESMAAGLRRHRKSALPPAARCPICAGRPYAMQGGRGLCGQCETRWPLRGKHEIGIVETGLEAFDARPLLALVNALDGP